MSTTDKKCTACGETKSIEAFGRDRSRKDGREPRCKACRRARRAATYVRKGHPTSRPKSRKHKPGNTYGSLILVERIEGNGQPRAVFRCNCGTIKTLQINNVVQGVTTNCADRVQHPDPRRKELLTYDGAHSRVKGQRGSASGHLCRCGDQAEQWAYSHADFKQRADPEGREKGRAYSINPDRYVPMCRSCHSRFDNEHRRLVGDNLSRVSVAYWILTQRAVAVAA